MRRLLKNPLELHLYYQVYQPLFATLERVQTNFVGYYKLYVIHKGFIQEFWLKLRDLINCSTFTLDRRRNILTSRSFLLPKGSLFLCTVALFALFKKSGNNPFLIEWCKQLINFSLVKPHFFNKVSIISSSWSSYYFRHLIIFLYFFKSEKSAVNFSISRKVYLWIRYYKAGLGFRWGGVRLELDNTCDNTSSIWDHNKESYLKIIIRQGWQVRIFERKFHWLNPCQISITVSRIKQENYVYKLKKWH